MDRPIILDKRQAWQKARNCVLLDSAASAKIEANHGLPGTAVRPQQGAVSERAVSEAPRSCGA